MSSSRTLFAFVFSMSSFASVASAQTSDRVWFDLSIVSSSPAQKEQIYTAEKSLFLETASAATAYPTFPRVTGGLFGGGVRLYGGLGVGVQATQTKYQYTVGLVIEIPHPTIFNRFATDSDVTASALERTDNAVDISVSYQLPTPDTWRVRLFGGPTFFGVKQDFVSIIRYTQQFNQLGANVVDITGFDQTTIDQSAWGYHVGIDVAFFFSRHFGAGGGLRVNSGTLSISNEPLSLEAAELKLGSTLAGAGLRIRF